MVLGVLEGEIPKPWYRITSFNRRLPPPVSLPRHPPPQIICNAPALEARVMGLDLVSSYKCNFVKPLRFSERQYLLCEMDAVRQKEDSLNENYQHRC